MQIEMEIAGRLRTVVVTRHGPHFLVVVDGARRVVDARVVGVSGLSLLVSRAAGDTPVDRVEAAFVPLRQTGAVDVYVNGRTVHTLVRPGGIGRRERVKAAGAEGHGPQHVVAPMPGKVVRVLVASGDRVAARQGLVVVEAMKMENELRAARDGCVREVTVTEGQSVEAGAVLVVVE